MTMPTRRQIHPVLLRVLRDWDGPARPRDVVSAVTAQFPQLAAEDLAARQADGRSSLWRNRVHWARQDLAQLGYIDATVRGIWSLTASGRAQADAQQQDHALPEPSDSVLSGERSVSEPDGPAPILLVQDPAEHLASQLSEAARDSSRPERLERAVADAMQFLGFEARVIGGAGGTDVHVSAPLGPLRYSVVIDAKSTADENVGDNQVNCLAIDRHRRAEAADHACVIGIGFAGGVLRSNAEQFDICLLTTDELSALLRLHQEQPLTLVELREVFATTPLPAKALADVRAAADGRGRNSRLIQFILTKMDELNRTQPDAVTGKTDVLWGAAISSGDQSVAGVTQQDITDTLQLLDRLGIIAKRNGDGYVSQTTIPGSLRMIGAVADNDYASTQSQASFEHQQSQASP